MSNQIVDDMKKERPILFKTEMVQAILSGRKMQTRRVVKGLNVTETEYGKLNYNFVKGKVYAGGINSGKEGLSDDFFGIGGYCPYGEVGDLLWVKETFYELPEPDSFGKYLYKSMDDKAPKWQPSLFMPKGAARIWLEITNIKVERLQDISEQDAINEGVEVIHRSDVTVYRKYNLKTPLGTTNPVLSFNTLWESINGEESWQANPWVWVIEFKRIKK